MGTSLTRLGAERGWLKHCLSTIHEAVGGQQKLCLVSRPTRMYVIELTVLWFFVLQRYHDSYAA